MKRHGDEPPQRPLVAVLRDIQWKNIRWKRTGLLVPVMVVLFFGTAIELGHPAASKARKSGGLVALLEDPLSLFAARSPGGRGAGALLSTKHKLASAGPEERVLSEERERPPADGGLPGGDNPVFGTAPGTTGGGAPAGDGAAPGGGPGGGGAPGGGGGAPGGGAPGGDDGALPGGGAPGDGGGSPFSPADFGAPQFLQNGPPGTVTNPPPPSQGPGSPSPGVAPPDSPPSRDAPPPGGPILNPGSPGLPVTIAAVPEPATWAEMLIGFFAIGAAVRRRVRRQARQACVP